MEKQRLDDALSGYDQVVEEEDAEPSTWNKMKKRANAVSELSLAVASTPQPFPSLCVMMTSVQAGR
eukprot:7031280-Pyramimonas_sp.AAC.2